ncbi:ATP-binding cassette domain-containing protein [Clostridium perfringens]
MKKFIKDFGLINKFKLDSIISMNGKNISGGEMQKISLIRSFIDDKDILIYDEPTSYLDINSKAYFLEYLSKIKESKKSIIIIITHDDDLKQISDELIDLETFKWTKLYS